MSKADAMFKQDSYQKKSNMTRFSITESKNSNLDKHLNLLIQIEQFSENLRNQKKTQYFAKKDDSNRISRLSKNSIAVEQQN